MFIDEARIRVKAGDGGNGCMAFRREKFVPRGGPSGGDGGHGGDILMRSSLSHNTLVHFRFNPEWKSGRGGHGLGSNMSGAEGSDILLEVPVGTVLYDDDTNELIHDFTVPNDQIVIARGGRGGRGNQHFATSTHQAPREHELGRSGEERHFRLELRLLADAGLVGFPNVGKSTLISRLSAARPKIANYPFTTLEPNLGVVQVGEPPHNLSFTVADMPGLIEGAHLGSGLGVQFLRHIERTAILVHLVDVSDTALGATPTPDDDDDTPDTPTPGTPTNPGAPSSPTQSVKAGSTNAPLSSSPDRGVPGGRTPDGAQREAASGSASSFRSEAEQSASSSPLLSFRSEAEKSASGVSGPSTTQPPSSRPEAQRAEVERPASATPEAPEAEPEAEDPSSLLTPHSSLTNAVETADPVETANPVETADPVENYRIITNELRSFDPALARKPTLVVATKLDAANPDKLRKLKDFARRRKLPFFAISAVTGEGVDKLKYAIAERVAEHRKLHPLPEPPAPTIYKPTKPKPHFPPPPPKVSGSRSH